MQLMVAIAFGYVAFAAQSATLIGRVVGVSDGDTITVLDAERQQHKVRLGGIDAPEKAQPFGRRARESLARLVFAREADIEWQKRDRYGRILGKVMISPQDCTSCPRTLDAGLSQVEGGLAWWYVRYAQDQAPQDRERYSHAEISARELAVGLWRDPVPTPPWEWRRVSREGRPPPADTVR